MIMKYFASIGLISLLSLLYACAYLDGDGLSKSPEETSYENIQGCFYSDKVIFPDYGEILDTPIVMKYVFMIPLPCIEKGILLM